MAGKVLLGRYELQEQIGVGGSGVVYLAWDRHLERYVAVKAEKQPESQQSEEGNRLEEREKEENAAALKKEMEMLSVLKHPMLPVIYDYFQETERYLVMEYIRGESLHNFIEREGNIVEKQAYRWAVQLAELLSYLHGQKPPVIYRDLKPDNIIVCPDGNLRVIDFGAALSVQYDRRKPEQLAGTPGYAAPEQFAYEIEYAERRKKPVSAGRCAKQWEYEDTDGYPRHGGYKTAADARSDIYTLGATLYHMLTGHNPAKPPYGIRSIRCMKPELTRDMERIVEKCTEEEPAERYQTAEELKEDLERQHFSGRRHFFRELRRKKRYVLKRMEKQIWLTEKATAGLFAAGLLLFGLFAGLFSIQVKGKETPLPVIVYNKQGQKLVIRYDSIFTPEGNLVFELEQELFGESGIKELSIGLTDCETGEKRERFFYIQGSGREGK